MLCNAKQVNSFFLFFVCVYFVYIVLFQNYDENNIVIEMFVLKQIGEFASSHSFDTKI
jgi:hypothetical protein